MPTRLRRGTDAALLGIVIAAGACAPASAPASPLAGETTAPTATAPSQSSTAEPAPTIEPVIATDPEIMDARYEAALPRFAYDPSLPLNTTLEPMTSPAGLRLDDVAYDSPKGGRVPGYLVRPLAEGTYPGLIVMHGSGGDRDDFLAQGQAYARLGVTVLLISAPAARLGQDWITLTPADADAQIQLLVDLRRAVDVLVEVGADPERIGFLGYSYGAAMGAGLAGIEPRIRAYVLDVGDGGLVSHFTGADDVIGELSRLTAEEREAWLAAMEPIEPIYLVRHAQASALLFQNGRFDELVPPADAERLHAAASEPKEVMWYETGHELSPQAWCDGAEWLRGHLGFQEGPLLNGCA